jgi:hypothetical protein
MSVLELDVVKLMAKYTAALLEGATAALLRALGSSTVRHPGWTSLSFCRSTRLFVLFIYFIYERWSD